MPDYMKYIAKFVALASITTLECFALDLMSKHMKTSSESERKDLENLIKMINEEIDFQGDPSKEYTTCRTAFKVFKPVP